MDRTLGRYWIRVSYQTRFFPCTNLNFDIHLSGRFTPNLNEDINLSSSRTLIVMFINEDINLSSFYESI
ncbi:hypothetical protein Hdeb2414_s0006g00191801 [Helianthus debilis subsp. tardiflorus]